MKNSIAPIISFLAAIPTVALWWEYSWILAISYACLFIAIVLLSASWGLKLDQDLNGIILRFEKRVADKIDEVKTPIDVDALIRYLESARRK